MFVTFFECASGSLSRGARYATIRMLLPGQIKQGAKASACRRNKREVQ